MERMNSTEGWATFQEMTKFIVLSTNNKEAKM